MCEMISPAGYTWSFLILFAVTFVYVARRDVVFAIFYLLLFVYTFFTELAYLYSQSTLAAQGIPLGLQVDWCHYQVFVRASFFAIFLIFALTLGRGTKSLRPVVRMPTKHSSLFQLLVAAFYIVLLLLYLQNAGSISYDQQDSLKGSGIFRNMFGFSNTAFIVLFAVLHIQTNRLDKQIIRVLLLFAGFVTLLIAAKAGSRGLFLVLPIGWLIYDLLSRRARGLRYWLKVLFLAIIVGYMAITLQVLRTSAEATLSSFVSALTQPSVLLQNYLFSPEGLLFQDYTGPSLLLLFSIEFKLVMPWEALRSVLLGGLPLTGVPSLGYITARIINPDLEHAWQGFGYYYLNEGFAIMGWWGVLYNALVCNLGYWIWRKLFVNVDDRNLMALMGSLAAMQAIDIVRAQSSNFIRGSIFSFVPALILYFLASGIRPVYFFDHRAKAKARRTVRSLVRR